MSREIYGKPIVSRSTLTLDWRETSKDFRRTTKGPPWERKGLTGWERLSVVKKGLLSPVTVGETTQFLNGELKIFVDGKYSFELKDDDWINVCLNVYGFNFTEQR